MLREEVISFLSDSHEDELCRVLYNTIEQCSKLHPKKGNRLKTLAALAKLFREVLEADRDQDVSTIDESRWRKARAILAIEYAIVLHKIILDLLLNFLLELTPHLRYWQQRLHQPVRFYIESGPKHWYELRPTVNFDTLIWDIQSFLAYIQSSQRKTIADKIHQINEYTHEIKSRIGRFHSSIAILSELNQFDDGEEYLVASRLTTDLYEFVKPDAHCEDDFNDVFRMDAALQELVDEIPVFIGSLKDFVRSVKRPSHLQRHWLSYTIGALVCGFGMRKTYQNRDQISLRCSETWDGLSLFAKERIQIPVITIYESVFTTFRNDSIVSKSDLEVNRESLANMLETFAVSDYQASIPTGALSDTKTVVNMQDIKTRAAQCDMSLVMSKYEGDIERPLRNMLTGDLLENMLIQIQKIKVDAESAMVELDQLLEQNQINFQVLAAIPAILLSFPIFLGLKSLIYRPIPVSKLKKEMKLICRAVDNVLITNYGDLEMNFHDSGELLLNLYRLKLCANTQKKASLVSEVDFFLLQQNIKMLEDRTLGIQQKRMVVERILLEYKDK